MQWDAGSTISPFDAMDPPVASGQETV